MSVRRTLTALALAGVLAAVAVSSSFRSSSRVVSPGELHGAGDATVQVAGTVVPGSLRRRGAVAEFAIAGDGRTVRVRYTGAAPNGLAPGRRVSVTGRYAHGRLTARADAVRVYCDEHC